MDEERAGLVASGLIKGDRSAIPEDCRWPVLRDVQGEELTRRYSAILETLSRRSGIVGTTFLKAQNEIQDPAKLRRLVGLIDGETWLGLGVDKSGRRHERAATEHFRRFAHAELVARDKVNPDIFWLKDDTLDDPDLLPPPDELAAEIV